MPAAVLCLQVPPGVRAFGQPVDGCWQRLDVDARDSLTNACGTIPVFNILWQDAPDLEVRYTLDSASDFT